MNNSITNALNKKHNFRPFSDEATVSADAAPSHKCQAVQQSDEMFCASCGLRWDVNDPDAPACLVEPDNWDEDGDRQRFDQGLENHLDKMSDKGSEPADV